MKLLIACLLTCCYCQEDDYYKKGYKLYLIFNNTYTIVDILAHSNATKFWGGLNQMHFTSQDNWNTSTSIIPNQSANHSLAVILGSETAEDFYYLEKE
jgi:hypothetical protein